MENPEHNQFGYVYAIGEESNITPPDDQLELMDAYMLDQQLVNLMQQVFENADQSFYQANTEIANDFFAGPGYPQCAVVTLGYPANGGNN